MCGLIGKNTHAILESLGKPTYVYNTETIVSHKKLYKAIEHILHLHYCEQEGVEIGMPTPEQWIKGVRRLEREYAKVKERQDRVK
jgi:hypothetical protein